MRTALPALPTQPFIAGTLPVGDLLVAAQAGAGVETGGGCPAWGAELAWPDAGPCGCKGPSSEHCPGGGFCPLTEDAKVRLTSASEKCRLVGWIHLTPLCCSQASCLPWPPSQPREMPAFSGGDSRASLSRPPHAGALTSCSGCGIAATGQTTLRWQQCQPALPLQAVPRETTASQIRLGWKGF